MTPFRPRLTKPLSPDPRGHPSLWTLPILTWTLPILPHLTPAFTPTSAGEEEPSLCGFICSKILAKSTPENILQDVAIVLEEEADVFVVKMWRLLIYETEAKKLGLVK